MIDAGRKEDLEAILFVTYTRVDWKSLNSSGMTRNESVVAESASRVSSFHGRNVTLFDVSFICTQLERRWTLTIPCA